MTKDNDTKSFGQTMLDGLDNATAEDWKRSWESARRQEIARQDWLLERLSGHPDHAALANHDCFEGGKVWHENFDASEIGESDDWEFELMICKACGRKYLRAFLESDGMPRSGRWFMGRMPPDTLVRDIKAESALRLLAQHDRLFYGGSYWGHSGKWSDVGNLFSDLFKLRIWNDG